MNHQTIRLKLSADLRQRIDRLARKRDETRNALMVRALEAQIDAMESIGVAYDADEVHAYLRARAAGRKAKRPKPVA